MKIVVLSVLLGYVMIELWSQRRRIKRLEQAIRDLHDYLGSVDLYV